MPNNNELFWAFKENIYDDNLYKTFCNIYD